jgi:hypothetical protein
MLVIVKDGTRDIHVEYRQNVNLVNCNDDEIYYQFIVYLGFQKFVLKTIELIVNLATKFLQKAYKI